MLSFKNTLGFLCLLVFWSGLLQAETLYTKTYFPGQSMDNKPIVCLAENEKGLLHIGSIGGLYQFDGMSYRFIALPDSLQQTEIKQIIFSKSGFFVGLKEGNLLFWNKTTGFEHLLKLSSAISTLTFDMDSTLWIGTYGDGIVRLSKDRQKFQITSENRALNDYIYRLHFNDDAIWAATDAGIFRIDNQADSLLIKQFTNLPDLIVTAMTPDPERGFWLGFQQGGFGYFDIQTGQVSKLQQTDERIETLKFAEGQLWISQSGKKLLSYSTTDNKTEIYHFPESVLPGDLKYVLPSKIGGLWVGTEKSFGWTAAQLIRFKSGFTEIQALLIDHKNKLWIASAEGLHHFERGTAEKVDFPLQGTAFENAFITCLHQTSDHRIWIGTFDQGLLCYHPKNKTIKQYTESSGLINNNILSLESHGDTLWIASLGGVSRGLQSNDQLRFQSFDQTNDPGANYVYHLFKDSKNRIWLGTDGQGLLYFENGYFNRPFPDTLAVNSIYSIAEAADGSIWFTASDNGIYRFHNNQLKHLTNNDGLSSMTVTSLQKAGDKFLIAVTAGGIDLIHTVHGVVYPLSNAYGLGSFQPGLNVICQDQNKTIYIGTPFGLQILNRVEELGYRKAALFLNELQSFGENLSEKATIKLNSRQNQLSASYTALWYPQPERLQFASKLDGYDQEYRLTRERQIHYNALEPGNYMLRIKLSGLPSYLPQPEISQHLKILLPLWKRWYVWIPGLLILILIGFLVMRQRIQKIRKEQQLRRERAEFEYQNLRNQVNPHFLFNSFSTLMALIEENGREALVYTEQLSDYFRQILQFRDTELISLKEELQLLENYLALQKKRYGDGLKMEIRIDENALNSLIPPMSLQMLAENALKHNQASRVMPLQISLNINAYELVFCNPLQPKQNIEKSTGLGIKNIAERYLNFANKHIRINKNDTHFCIYLPLIFK